MRWFYEQVVAVKPGQKVLDIGCGPAVSLSFLPQGIDYVGVDVSEAYIAAAKEKYGNRGVFLSGSVEDWVNDPRTRDADVVMAVAMLHHLDDDEAFRVLRFAHQIMKDGARFVFYEPCYLAWHSKLSRYLMSKDRGQNIRTEQEWKDMVSSIFPRMSTNVLTGVNCLLYVCMIGQCYKNPHDAPMAAAMKSTG